MTLADLRPRWARPLALTLAALTMATSAATAALAIMNRALLPNLDAADPIAIVVPIGLSVVGALVASRQPRNATGWLFLIAASVTAMGGAADQYARFGLTTHPGALPGAIWVLWFSSWSLPLVFPTGAVAMLMLLLPDGHLPSRRWRPVVAVGAVFAGIFLFIGAFTPGPLVPQTSAAWTSTPLQPRRPRRAFRPDGQWGNRGNWTVVAGRPPPAGCRSVGTAGAPAQVGG